MSSDSPSSGIISSAELEELASLFDRWEFALDPTSEDCKTAEIQFQDRVQELFDTKVHAAYPDLKFIQFFCGVKAQAPFPQVEAKLKSIMTLAQIEQTKCAWPVVGATLRVPHSEIDYNELVALLDSLVDEVGEDEDHPLTSLMEVLSVLIEKYEDEHVPELGS